MNVLNWNSNINLDISICFSDSKCSNIFESIQKQEEKSKSQSDFYIKLMCSWCSNEDLLKLWKKMFNTKFNLKFVNSEKADYYIIINKPPNPYEYYEPSKTIVFRMEPDTFLNPIWNDWYLTKGYNKKDFMFFFRFRNI